MLIKPLKNFSGIVQLPGDKAITLRAIILSSVAQGAARVSNASTGTDCLAAIDCMARLGAKIKAQGSMLTITGVDKNLKSDRKLYVSGSGATLKLLTGLLAGAGVSAVIDGNESLRKRPMFQFIEPFLDLGAKITTKNGYAPISIKPTAFNRTEIFLHDGGALEKAALMLAGLTAKDGLTIYDESLEGSHTEIMLSEMSADIERGPGRVMVRPSPLKSIDIDVPGDISYAVYFIVAATVISGSHILLKKVGINPTRAAIIDVINSCGGSITVLNPDMSGGEKTADLLVDYSPRIKPFNITAGLTPRLLNEIPALAVMACFTLGRSRISSCGELRNKESDRLESIVSVLREMGARIKADGDDIVVDGGGVLNGGAVLDPKGDHRIAMAMAVAAAASLEGAKILTPEVVNKGYPGFFEEFIEHSEPR